MSISKDFENHAIQFYGEDVVHYHEGPVTELLAHTRALEAMLKTNRWIYVPGCEPFCICCKCSQRRHEEDSEDCPLSKLLEGVE